jgi:hypothetical protein
MIPLTNTHGVTIYVRADTITEVAPGDYGLTNVWMGRDRCVPTRASISDIIDRIAEATK